MTERNIRKYHGRIGIILSIFILIQVGSGTIIAFNTILEQRPHTHDEYSNVNVHDRGDSNDSSTPETDLLKTIHHHGETIFQVLRIILGVGILTMVISGATIYILTQKRMKKNV